MSIIEIKTYLKNQIQKEGDTLENALECLEQLVSQGMEYPNAEAQVLEVFTVSQEQLMEAYDSL
ncbi:hypothetical protein ACQWTT_001129 [Acinetobacter baumannii]